MKDINGLSKEDGFSSWRKSESASLAAELEKRLKLLQNPEDCTTAKKLICNLNKVGIQFSLLAFYLTFPTLC